MMNDEQLKKIIQKIKTDTNYVGDITFRVKKVCQKNVYIIYNEPLTSSDKISDFIVRSLDRMNRFSFRHISFSLSKFLFLIIS